MTRARSGHAAWRVVLAAVAAVALVLVVAVASHPLWLGPAVTRYLTAKAGREVHVDAIHVGFDGALRPVLRFSGVRIANAPWADPAWPLADLREAVMVLSWRSLFEERRVIERFVLRDGRVDLERLADGARNWRLRDPENRGAGRYRVLSLEAERATLRFAHHGLDLAVEVASTPSIGDPRNRNGDALPVRLAFTGAWRGQRFTADVATVPELTFYDTGRAFPLRGTLHAGDLQLDLDGRAGDLFRDPLFDADASLAGRSLAAVRAAAGGGPMPEGVGLRPWRVAAHVKADATGAALEGLRIALGGSDAAGSATLVHADRDRLRAELASGVIDVDDLQWLAASFAGIDKARDGMRDEMRDAAASRAASAPASAASAAGDDRSHRRPLDAELALDAKRVRWARVPTLGRATLRLATGTGKPSEATVDVAVAGGHASGHATLRRDAEPPTAEVDATVRGVKLETLLPQRDEKKRVTGLVAGRARLSSTRSAGGWIDGLAGSVDASLGSGSIGSLLDAEMGLQGFRALRAWIGGASAVPVRCASVGLDLKDGRGRLRGLVLDTARTVVRGTGAVDLDAKTFDLTLSADAKDRGVFVIDRSIRLHGPFAKPARELVPRVGMPASSCVG